MGFLDAIGGFWTGLRTKSAPAQGGGYGGAGLFVNAFRSRRQPTLPELVEAFRSIAYACATINANAGARSPLRLYVKTRRGQSRPKCVTKALDRHRREHLRTKAAAMAAGASDIEEVVEHPLIESLTNANPAFDMNLLVYYWLYCLDVTGWFHAWPESRSPGQWYVWPLQAQYVFPIRDGRQAVVKGFQYLGETYEPEDLISGRLVSVRDPYGYGYSPLQAAFEEFNLNDRFQSVQNNLLASGLKPSLIVSPKDQKAALGNVERARLEHEINQGFGGDRAGRAWVIDSALDVKPLSLPPTDIAGLNIARHVLERFANIFGVPIAMLTSETNLANLQASRAMHAENAVEPRHLRIATALTRWTHAQARKSPRLGWDRLFWAFDPVSQEDRDLTSKLEDLDLKNGSRTINEVRTARGDEPVEWGDEPWFPTSLVQPSTAAESREQARLAIEAQRQQPAEPPAAEIAPPEPAQKSAEGEHRRHFRGSSDEGPPRGAEHVRPPAR